MKKELDPDWSTRVPFDSYSLVSADGDHCSTITIHCESPPIVNHHPSWHDSLCREGHGTNQAAIHHELRTNARNHDDMAHDFYEERLPTSFSPGVAFDLHQSNRIAIDADET